MIIITDEDITLSKAEAIVNASNGIGWMGGQRCIYEKHSGVAENIQYASKGEVEKLARQECRKNNFLFGLITTGFHLGMPGLGRAYHPWDNLPKCKCGGYPYMVSRNNECCKSDEPNRIYCRQCRKTTSFGTVTEIRKEWTEINRGDC